MTSAHEAPQSTEINLDLPSAADIRNILEQKKQAKTQDALSARRAHDEEERHRKEMFLARKLTPQFINTVMSRVRRAAENGETNVLVGQFPCEWCSDGGRLINIAGEDWPDTLPGIAREFFEFWQRELSPKGFKLSAQIVSFRDGGIPGDVGAYLSWKA